MNNVKFNVQTQYYKKPEIAANVSLTTKNMQNDSDLFTCCKTICLKKESNLCILHAKQL